MSGCRWWSSSVCGEFPAKLLRELHSCWSAAWASSVSKSVAMIPRFESFTCHHLQERPLTSVNAGWGHCVVSG